MSEFIEAVSGAIIRVSAISVIKVEQQEETVYEPPAPPISGKTGKWQVRVEVSGNWHVVGEFEESRSAYKVVEEKLGFTPPLSELAQRLLVTYQEFSKSHLNIDYLNNKLSYPLEDAKRGVAELLKYGYIKRVNSHMESWELVK